MPAHTPGIVFHRRIAHGDDGVGEVTQQPFRPKKGSARIVIIRRTLQSDGNAMPSAGPNSPAGEHRRGPCIGGRDNGMSQNEIRFELADRIHHVPHSPPAPKITWGDEKGGSEVMHALELRHKSLLGRLQGAKTSATPLLEMQRHKRLHQSLYS